MEKSLVSAIIPVYNGEQFLKAAIDSILAQTYAPVEVIVVDDGSIDKTAEIIQSYQEVRYIYQTNHGHAHAKNIGIKAAKGDIIAFLDADDIWTPNKLEVQVGYLLKHPEVGYTICQMRCFLETGIDYPSWLPKDKIDSNSPAYIPSGLVAYKRVFAQIGNFNPAYRHSNDTDWFFRARNADIAMQVIPEILLERRIHKSNLSYEQRYVISERYRVLKSLIENKRQQQVSK